MTAQTSLRPLARSLVPLADETLSGYLLRLAHRLCIDPGRLAKLTGLTGGKSADTTIVRLAMNLVFRLDDQARSQFAEVTRLTPAEVDGLLLESLGTRYGPLDPQYSKAPDSSRVIAHNPWVFTETIRFCPECLAGDGSEVEGLHGGAWRRSWRLPVVFACPQHRRLLLDRCPQCAGLAHAGGQTSMIARLNDDELHPTQCRSTPGPRQIGHGGPACGADLTRSPGNRLRELSPQTRRTVFALQNRFTQLLAADGPTTTGSVGWSVPVAQYFMDLRAVTTLIFMTWPEARPHAATPTLAEALDIEAQQRHDRYLERRAAPGKTQAVRAYSDPSTDPLAAAVFDIADRFLRSPDENTAATLLSPLAAEARYAHQPLSYSIRRSAGTSFPLQVVLLTHRSRSGIQDNITEIIERREDLTRC